eukprot:CAMPEP_0197289734 /NCGR_PEP_ID=MMETSP0890-20130614/7005_1 /TAXON_ID=44058 ORGANISM="Aureoumbra lagunensis, Strain CCMP1510" /NCGR_SAMPLE_ID=MMETSP0890 /ASSEMBLY_ACC=CAM_ASM_000533 /LENGTH=461 /DNA_ID=CAMNT_0042761331 /DNA_START=299 /DNA_END=1681 /DNA_ORIENTATION=+
MKSFKFHASSPLHQLFQYVYAYIRTKYLTAYNTSTIPSYLSILHQGTQTDSFHLQMKLTPLGFYLASKGSTASGTKVSELLQLLNQRYRIYSWPTLADPFDTYKPRVSHELAQDETDDAASLVSIPTSEPLQSPPSNPPTNVSKPATKKPSSSSSTTTKKKSTTITASLAASQPAPPTTFFSLSSSNNSPDNSSDEPSPRSSHIKKKIPPSSVTSSIPIVTAQKRKTASPPSPPADLNLTSSSKVPRLTTTQLSNYSSFGTHDRSPPRLSPVYPRLSPANYALPPPQTQRGYLHGLSEHDRAATITHYYDNNNHLRDLPRRNYNDSRRITSPPPYLHNNTQRGPPSIFRPSPYNTPNHYQTPRSHVTDPRHYVNSRDWNTEPDPNYPYNKATFYPLKKQREEKVRNCPHAKYFHQNFCIYSLNKLFNKKVIHIYFLLWIAQTVCTAEARTYHAAPHFHPHH